MELLANQAVWRDQPVEAFVPDREALANIEYRSKKEIDGDVRIVRIEGVDTCACCGTHVHTTGAVGQIKVVGVQKYKSGVRVSILCGRRALAYENAMLDQAKAAGHALSVPTKELSGAVERMLGERDRLRAQNDALGMRIFDLLAQREAKNAIRVVACDALPAAHARRVAQVFEKLRRRLKRRGILRRGMQMMFAHTTFSPFAPFFAQTEGPFAQSEEVVRKPLRGRSQCIILRSQRINKCLIVKFID